MQTYGCLLLHRAFLATFKLEVQGHKLKFIFCFSSYKRFIGGEHEHPTLISTTRTYVCVCMYVFSDMSATCSLSHAHTCNHCGKDRQHWPR